MCFAFSIIFASWKLVFGRLGKINTYLGGRRGTESVQAPSTSRIIKQVVSQS